jgi:hypothetical protein
VNRLPRLEPHDRAATHRVVVGAGSKLSAVRNAERRFGRDREVDTRVEDGRVLLRSVPGDDEQRRAGEAHGRQRHRVAEGMALGE